MQLLSFPNIKEESSDDMANVSESRIQKIEEKLNTISEKIAALPGSIKTLFWTVGIIVSVLLVGGGFAVKEFIDISGGLATVKESQRNIEKSITEVKQLVMAQRLVSASTNPSDPQNIKEMTKILATAKQEGINIDSDLIKETGSKFIAASATYPQSWDAVRQYLAYRSFLNINIALKLISNLPPIAITPSSHNNIFINGFGKTDDEKSARFETLSGPRQTSNMSEYIVVRTDRDGELILDNRYMKNVIVKDMRIIYRGGPIRLEKVYFVNCTFDFDQNNRSRELGGGILASAAVEFKST